MSLREAKARAHELGLDLVEIAPEANPPVCTVMDYSKWLYDQKKRTKETKSKPVEMKEIRLSAGVEEHDILVKGKQLRKFLEQGKHVKLTIFYRKRQIVHKDRGFEVMNKLVGLIDDVGKTDSRPNIQGRNLSVKIVPIS